MLTLVLSIPDDVAGMYQSSPNDAGEEGHSAQSLLFVDLSKRYGTANL